MAALPRLGRTIRLDECGPEQGRDYTGHQRGGSLSRADRDHHDHGGGSHRPATANRCRIRSRTRRNLPRSLAVARVTERSVLTASGSDDTPAEFLRITPLALSCPTNPPRSRGDRNGSENLTGGPTFGITAGPHYSSELTPRRGTSDPRIGDSTAPVPAASMDSDAPRAAPRRGWLARRLPPPGSTYPARRQSLDPTGSRRQRADRRTRDACAPCRPAAPA